MSPIRCIILLNKTFPKYTLTLTRERVLVWSLYIALRLLRRSSTGCSAPASRGSRFIRLWHREALPSLLTSGHLHAWITLTRIHISHRHRHGEAMKGAACHLAMKCCNKQLTVIAQLPANKFTLSRNRTKNKHCYYCINKLAIVRWRCISLDLAGCFWKRYI